MTKFKEVVKDYCKLCDKDTLSLCFDEDCPQNESFFNDSVLERLPSKNSCALRHEGEVVTEESNELILI